VRLLGSIASGILICLFTALVTESQELAKGNTDKPVELEAVDPEIRALLEKTPATCEQFNIDDTIARVQKALKIADSGGLIRDRAIAEATLASAYIGQAEIELAFTTFQKALQDAMDSKILSARSKGLNFRLSNKF
jgi:hypothetical protein